MGDISKMNIRILPAFLLAAVFTAPAFGTTNDGKDQRAVGYYASKVSVPAWDNLLQRRESYDIVAGVSQTDVKNRMGEPKQTLAPNVWLYENCKVNYSPARDQGCTLLVITFDDGRISEMKFVNKPMAAAIAANARVPASSYVATK